MQIPSYWAEARAAGKVKGRTRTVRRFGWSNESEAEARRHAEERAWQTLLELQAGRRIAAIERKLAYGDEGLPIREEVIARDGDRVVTRNRYGARCLNEPDVWFGDLDLAPRLAPLVERVFSRLVGILGAFSFLAAVAFFARGHPGLGCSSLVAMIGAPLVLLVWRVRLRARPGVEQAHRDRVQQRIADFVAGLPRSRFAVYETPAGFRLMALHRTFDPRSDEAQAMFRDLDCDPAYARLCRLQACFRTRVSAKPWRIGLTAIIPRGVWPVPFERLDEREQWVETYETKSREYAACRFLEELGDGTTDPRCAEVQRVHDEMCRARTDLPIA